MADLLRVSILGTMPGGESWSINPVYAFTAPLALSLDELTSAVTAINAVSVPANLLGLNVAGVIVTGARVEARKKTGELEGVAEGGKTVPQPGNATPAHPFQTSLVTSLRTADSSARGKGRLYWPATAVTIEPTTLRVNTAARDAYLAAMNSYLASLRTAIRGVGGMTTAVLSVWSRTNADTRVVLSMRAGDIADVQRRRRDKIAENYGSVVVAAL